MRIAVVGGGPGGLYFSLLAQQLARQLGQEHEIDLRLVAPAELADRRVVEGVVVGEQPAQRLEVAVARVCEHGQGAGERGQQLRLHEGAWHRENAGTASSHCHEVTVVQEAPHAADVDAEAVRDVGERQPVADQRVNRLEQGVLGLCAGSAGRGVTQSVLVHPHSVARVCPSRPGRVDGGLSGSADRSRRG